MKKQTIIAAATYLFGGAFFIALLFLLGPAMHQALGQVAPPSTGAITGTYAAPAKPAANIPAIGQSQLPTASSDVTTAAPAGVCSYMISQIGGSIVPGTTDIGNHGDDTVTTIALPFSYTLYDQTFTSINLSSNGNAQFTTTDATFTNVCLPWLTHNYSIYPYWDDLYLVNAGFGIFTSISGTAPNRIFNIEWRAQYFPGSGSANFELRLYEGQSRFDVIYGTLTNGNTSATAGVQKDNTTFDQYFCNGSGGAATGGQSYTLQSCGPPPCSWVVKAPLLFNSRGPFAVSDGTFVYIGGGYDGTTVHADLLRYDPVANTYTPLAPSADAHFLSQAVYNNGKIYNIAGFNLGGQSNTTRIYDIPTNTWTTGAPLPTLLSDHATAYSNGKIYVAGGYNGRRAAVNTLYIYDIASNSWTTGAPMPAALYLPGFGIINGKLYVASGNNGSTEVNTLYIYDIASNTWSTGATVPTPVTGPGSTVFNGKLYLFGGAAPFPTTITATQIYDPVANSWSSGPAMNVARLWFYGAAVGSGSIVAPGGDTSPGIPINDNEQLTGCGPAPCSTMWTLGTPYPTTIVRYGFAQTATHFYVFGGVNNGATTNAVNRMDIATGTWQSRAPMPFSSEAPTCALMASTGIVYCADGLASNGFASYNIATDTWTPLASDPFVTDHYGSASGAFNGKVFVAGGTGAETNAVDVYDVATNTWSAGTAAPNDFLLAGYQQVGQYLYVVGGFSPSGPVNVAGELSSVLSRGLAKQPAVPLANNTTTLRLDMSSAPGVWSTGPAFTPGRADFGLAYDAGTNKLYAMGGDATGGGFFDSTNLVDELSVASWPGGSWAASPPNLPLPNRQANQAGFYGAGQIWSVGGLDGSTFTFLAEVQRRSNSCAPVPSSAVSRKVHGGAGTFDVNLPLVAIGGAVGIECRTGAVAGAHQEVITFASPVTVSGVAVTSGTGSATFSVAGAVVTVNLTGVTNAQRLGVTLMNVNDGTSTGDVLIPMGVLSGDTNANGAVNAGDAAQTKGQSGIPVGAGNFREDVNSNGSINAGDVAIVKGKAGTALPP